VGKRGVFKTNSEKCIYYYIIYYEIIPETSIIISKYYNNHNDRTIFNLGNVYYSRIIFLNYKKSMLI